jgi:hypothetical protein
MGSKRKRAYTDTTVPYVPASELDMAVLLKVKPPPDDFGKPRARKKKKAALSKRRRA